MSKLGWLVLVVASQAAASDVVLGSFTQSAGATQTVPHSLSLTPKAIIVWSSGVTGTLIPRPNSAFCVGFSDGVGQYTVESTVTTGQPSITSSRTIAPVLLTFDTTSGTALARATLQSWNATSFTLAWSSNDNLSRRIHYVLVGGADVSAKAFDYLSRTSAGAEVVTGIGFRPDVVLNLYAATASSTLPSNTPVSHLHVSAFSNNGQWSLGENVQNTLSNRYFQPRATYITQTTTPQMAADVTLFDVDGYTLNVTDPPSAAVRMMGLALKGNGLAVGSVRRNAVQLGTTQSVTGLPFAPEVVWLATGFASGTMAATSAQWSIGASNGTIVASSQFLDVAGANPTVVTSGEGGNVFEQPVLNPEEEAQLISLDPSGFTVQWNLASSASVDWGYVAFGNAVNRADAGVDAGTDAGVDAGAQVDAGVVDAGSPDAGSADAGQNDAGQPDAGASDAGLPPDAGPVVDAGNEPDAGPPRLRQLAVGCGCGSSPLGPILMAMLALARRRR